MSDAPARSADEAGTLQKETREVPVPLGERARELWPLLVFVTLYVVVATVVALAQGNAEFLMYVGVMVVLVAFVWAVDRWVVLSPGVLWLLSLWGIFHMAGGLVPIPEAWPHSGEPVLYSLWIFEDRLKYDHLVHASGFGVTTWACWQALRRALAGAGVRPVPGWGVLLLCAMAGMGFGAVNEVAEFVATLLVPETNVGGYVNTGWDLVANLVGTVTAILLIRYVPAVRRGRL